LRAARRFRNQQTSNIRRDCHSKDLRERKKKPATISQYCGSCKKYSWKLYSFRVLLESIYFKKVSHSP